MKTPLNICVVGYGRIAQSHLSAALEIANLVRIIGIVSRSPEKAKECMEKFCVPRSYSSLEEALLEPDIDAIVLCLPNHLHAQASVKCLSAGKHVLVEKPMANTVDECDLMIQAAERNGKILMIGQSRRFYESVFESKRIAEQNRLGRLMTISADLYGYLLKSTDNMVE